MGKKITVAGTGYVGLSLAVLLAQNNKVMAVDIIPEKVEMINNRKSPIQDDYIEKYFVEKGNGLLIIRKFVFLFLYLYFSLLIPKYNLVMKCCMLDKIKSNEIKKRFF